MLPTFLILSRRLVKRRAWYVGLALYWATWCTAAPLMLVGREGVKEMFRPARRDPVAAVLPPLASTLGGTAAGGAGPRRESAALACTAVLNNFGEPWTGTGIIAAAPSW